MRRIEFQAALLADNPNYNLDLQVTQNLLKEKSTDLLSAVIKFFNSALIYFSEGVLRKLRQCTFLHLVNVSKTIWKGPQLYEDGKKLLDIAIREYNQAVMHLTAHVVAGEST